MTSGIDSDEFFPRVTIVVPCYNYGHFVTDAVDSLLSQTYESLEILIVDDASTDNTRTVIGRYDDHPQVRILQHQTNKGNIRTFNDGIQEARGEFVGLLSADDFCINPDAIRRQVEMFDAYPNVGFVHGAYDLVDEHGERQWSFRSGPSDSVQSGLIEFQRLCFSCYVAASGTLVRAQCHDALGAYDPELPVSADWDLWLRLCTAYDVGYIADPLFAYRTHSSNMHHSGVRAERATSNHVATIERAFARLPSSAPAELRVLRDAAIENAWLVYSADARRGGRARQSWIGLADAARRCPRLLLRPSWYGAAARTATLSLVGSERYGRLVHSTGRR